MTDELAWMDATAIAECIDVGELDPETVIEFTLAQIDHLNSRVNAVVVSDGDQAMQRASACRGPLGGVPILIDDLTQVSGLPCSSGSRLWEGEVSVNDDHLVTRYRHAGLNVVGKSNVSELGIALTTESQFLGICANPWDLTRSPGGPTGGAAAAVASGMVPIAHATDSLGGLRISAASCGLVGLKPTRARTPLGPGNFAGWSGLTASHVVARTVRDAALCLDCTQGPAMGDPYQSPVMPMSAMASLEQPLGALRIAVDLRPMNNEKVSGTIRNGLATVSAELSGLGHEVNDRSVEYDRERLSGVLTTLVVSEVRNRVLGRCEQLGIDPTADLLERCTLSMVEVAAELTADVYVRALHEMYRSTLILERFFGESDIIMTPTTKTLPPVLGHLDTTVDADVYLDRAGEFSGFTSLYNLSGHPAMTLPLYWTDEGLPVGVQFVAPFGHEGRLLALAAQLESAIPWAHRRPTTV
ncbi:MAG: amidase [Pseudomonadota bacterium]